MLMKLLLEGDYDPRDRHSFPTRRSSDLYYTRGHHVAAPETIRRAALGDSAAAAELLAAVGVWEEKGRLVEHVLGLDGEDRKSTRLNSSHSQISYAVFCLKKEKHINLCRA